MDKALLNTTARALVARKKGILAADESLRSTSQRFAPINLPHTEENRRAYRDMMPAELAISELRKNAGTQFDPHIVDVFISVIRRGGILVD